MEPQSAQPDWHCGTVVLSDEQSMLAHYRATLAPEVAAVFFPGILGDVTYVDKRAVTSVRLTIDHMECTAMIQGRVYLGGNDSPVLIMEANAAASEDKTGTQHPLLATGGTFYVAVLAVLHAEASVRFMALPDFLCIPWGTEAPTLNQVSSLFQERCQTTYGLPLTAHNLLHPIIAKCIWP